MDFGSNKYPKSFITICGSSVKEHPISIGFNEL